MQSKSTAACPTCGKRVEVSWHDGEEVINGWSGRCETCGTIFVAQKEEVHYAE